MNQIEPIVLKLAETKINDEGVRRLAQFYAAQDWLNKARQQQPNDTEFLVELAGRTCYRSFGAGLNPNVTKIRDNSRSYLTNVLEKGDGSILEHATVTFAFLNVSRIFCYSEDTEVLTSEGWKKFPELDGTEEFLTLDPYSFAIEYLPACNYLVEAYSGKMVHFKSSMVDLLVTPNHRVYFFDSGKRSKAARVWKFSRADALTGKPFFLKTDGAWRAPDVEVMIVPSVTISALGRDARSHQECGYEDLEIPFDAYARFIGFFDAEGSLDHHYGSPYCISIYQSQTSQHINEIVDTTRAMGFQPAIIKMRESELALSIHNYPLYTHLRKFGSAPYEKRVPDEIKRASARQIALYLDSYVKGDGNVHQKNDESGLHTSSSRMADDLQELALKAGVSASIQIKRRAEVRPYEKHDEAFGHMRPSYIVSFREKSSLSPPINHGQKSERTHVSLTDYSGKIYCVSVPPNELLYVRRNGKPVWCGNTHELVRHRAGTAISQESMRFVRPREIRLWMPPELETVSAKVEESVKEIKKRYHDLEAQFSWDEMPFDQKKRVTSALRRILPDGMATNIIWTANHRTIRWVIQMRTHPSAEIEIRKVFGKVAEICKRDYPLLYADFEEKPLPDSTSQYTPKYSKV